MRGLQPHKSTVADYNIAGALQSMLKAVQELDTEEQSSTNISSASDEIGVFDINYFGMICWLIIAWVIFRNVYFFIDVIYVLSSV
jgi:hypothetical protein